MSGPGRNDPCPCGSGRKYKACCLQAQEAARTEHSRPAAAHPFHAADERAVQDMLRFADATLGRRAVQAALQAWDLELGGHEAPLAMQLALHVHRIDGSTIASRYAAAGPKTWRHAAVLEAQRGAWLSAWEFLRVRPDEGFDVRDLLTGEERSVSEIAGSHGVVARDVLLARVAQVEGTCVVAGSHPRVLPPGAAAEVVALVRRFLDESAASPTVERMRDEETSHVLVGAWKTTVEFFDRRPEPKLTNTDGDPLLLTTDHFRFGAPDRDEIRRRLASAEGATDADSDAVTFTRPGNAMNPGWDNTIVGRAEIGESSLTISTNSLRRADDLRARVEAACGPLVSHRAREHSDPMSPALRARAAAARRAPPSVPPEVVNAMLREAKAKHYAGWADHPLPALNGVTPREAVATARGRREVDLLLKELENGEARQPPEVRVDLSGLRADLGLPG